MYSTIGSQYLVIEWRTLLYKKYVQSIRSMSETSVSIIYVDDQCKNCDYMLCTNTLLRGCMLMNHALLITLDIPSVTSTQH